LSALRLGLASERAEVTEASTAGKPDTEDEGAGPRIALLVSDSWERDKELGVAFRTAEREGEGIGCGSGCDCDSKSKFGGAVSRALLSDME
jgi:hypothetical protein